MFPASFPASGESFTFQAIQGNALKFLVIPPEELAQLNAQPGWSFSNVDTETTARHPVAGPSGVPKPVSGEMCKDGGDSTLPKKTLVIDQETLSPGVKNLLTELVNKMPTCTQKSSSMTNLNQLIVSNSKHTCQSGKQTALSGNMEFCVPVLHEDIGSRCCRSLPNIAIVSTDNCLGCDAVQSFRAVLQRTKKSLNKIREKFETKKPLKRGKLFKENQPSPNDKEILRNAIQHTVVPNENSLLISVAMQAQKAYSNQPKRIQFSQNTVLHSQRKETAVVPSNDSHDKLKNNSLVSENGKELKGSTISLKHITNRSPLHTGVSNDQEHSTKAGISSIETVRRALNFDIGETEKEKSNKSVHVSRPETVHIHVHTMPSARLCENTEYNSDADTGKVVGNNSDMQTIRNETVSWPNGNLDASFLSPNRTYVVNNRYIVQHGAVDKLTQNETEAFSYWMGEETQKACVGIADNEFISSGSSPPCAQSSKGEESPSVLSQSNIPSTYTVNFPVIVHVRGAATNDSATQKSDDREASAELFDSQQEVDHSKDISAEACFPCKKPSACKKLNFLEGQGTSALSNACTPLDSVIHTQDAGPDRSSCTTTKRKANETYSMENMSSGNVINHKDKNIFKFTPLQIKKMTDVIFKLYS